MAYLREHLVERRDRREENDGVYLRWSRSTISMTRAKEIQTNHPGNMAPTHGAGYERRQHRKWSNY